MIKKGCRFEIILNVLRVVQKEKNLQRYFDFLLKEGLITKNKDCYRLTANGADLLNKLEDMEYLIH